MTTESSEGGLPEGDGLPPPDRWSHHLAERLRVWWRWIGPGRVLGGVGVAAVVAAVAVWLVRSPSPPTEARLPMASRPPVELSAPPSPVATLVAPPVTTAPTVVVVHVAGAVGAPGVYELPAGARVADAIAAAGGPTGGADPNTLNLAAPVLDGDRVAVPLIGEPAYQGGGQTHAGTAAASGPLDLNRATVDELDALPGVGPATAAAIVAHREANGPFASVDELEAVRGIGPAKLETIRPLVTV
jgi:competence protein ComEA